MRPNPSLEFVFTLINKGDNVPHDHMIGVFQKKNRRSSIRNQIYFRPTYIHTNEQTDGQVERWQADRKTGHAQTRVHTYNQAGTWRRCDVMTSHRRQKDVISTLCARLEVLTKATFSLSASTQRPVPSTFRFSQTIAARHTRLVVPKFACDLLVTPEWTWLAGWTAVC